MDVLASAVALTRRSAPPSPATRERALPETTFLSCDLKDGYYLVLLADHRMNEGTAWHKLDECRARLLAEM